MTITGDPVYHQALSVGNIPSSAEFSSISADDTLDHLDGLLGPTVDQQVLFNALRACYHPHRLYETRTHLDIYMLLGDLTLKLVKGELTRFSCRTLVGVKGTGKTFALKAFAKGIPLLVPRIMVVYLSAKELSTSVSESVAAQLKHHFHAAPGWVPFHAATAEEGSNQLCRWILARLEQLDMRLLLIVNEMVHLYTHNGIEDPWAVQTLHDLAFLGDQTSGRISTVLCGSSAFLVDLLGCKLNRMNPTHRCFPLLDTGAIPIDWTQFRMERIACPLPTDLATVASMMDLCTSEKNHLKKVRSVAVVSGCTVCEVHRALRSADGQGPSNEAFYLPWSCHADPVMSLLADTICERIYQRNKPLCELLFAGTAEQIASNIQCIAWEQKLSPITLLSCQAAFNQMLLEREAALSLAEYAFHFQDLQWFVFSFTGMVGVLIHPASLLHLMPYSKGSDKLPQVRSILLRAVQGAPESLAHVLAQPIVAAAVAAIGTTSCTIS